MLYEVYQKKINRIARILAKIVRLLPLILTVLAVIMALIAGYMLMKGMVFSMACPTQATYGDSMEYHAKVFLSDVHYEHCAIGSEKWNEGLPVTAGRFQVRAVTENVFGNPRYGKPAEITILPKEITVGVSDTAVLYGNDLTLSGTTAPGDRLVCDRYVFVRTSALSNEALFAQYNVTPDTSAVRVLDAKGNDVTSSYRISVKTASVKIEKLQITVTVPDASKVYDGEALTSERFDITQGSLCDGDRLEGTFKDSITPVGSVDNKPTFRVLNEDGEDVTEYYAVNYVYGKLTVEKKPVLITTGSTQTVYNGESVSNPSYTVDAEHGPILGHTVVMDGEWLSFTNAGSHLNTMNFLIKDAAGVDQTGNYDLQITEGAILISPSPLYITTESAEWVYDGKTHSPNGYTAEGLLTMHTLAILLGLEVADVGEYKNEILFVIRSASGEDMTNNYDIIGNYGICKITPRPLHVVTGSAEVVYNGAPHSANTFHQEGMVDTHYIQFISWTQETDANVYTNVMDFIIRDESDRDVTFNYEITRTFGTLTIKPRPITMTTKDQTWIYDGNEHSHPSYEVSGLVEGHESSFVDASKIRDVGQLPNEIVIKIINENGESVSHNYEMTALYGTLTVTPRPITIRTDGGTWIYDSMEHRISSYGIVSELGLANGERLIIDDTVSVIDVGKAENKPIAFDIVRLTNGANSESSLANYEITWEYGILEILPRPIFIKPVDQSKIYDAKTILADRWEYTADSQYQLIPWHTINLTYSGELTDVGYIPTAITSVQITDSNQSGRDVTFNYQIVLEEGFLEILPRPISLKPVDQSKVYDGTPLIADDWEYTADSQYQLVSWHTICLTYSGSLTDVGRIPSYITSYQILDPEQGMRDVTHNYEVACLEGYLEIFPRTISIQPVDRTEVYNGKPLVAVDWKYTDDNKFELLPGHELRATYSHQLTAYGLELIDVTGQKINSFIDSVQILDSEQGMKNVTSNYRIECREGTLEVVPRPIWIKPRDEAKKYDGTPLTPYRWEYMQNNEYELVSGHRIQMTYKGSQREIGRSESFLEGSYIFDGNQEVTNNYFITADPGILCVYEDVPELPEEPEVPEAPQIPGLLPDSDSSDIRDENGDGNTENDGESFVVGEVKAESTGILYLRLRAYGNYQGGTWTSCPAYDKLLPGGFNYNYLTSAALANSGLYAMTATFRNMLTTVLPYYLALEGGDYTKPQNDISNVPMSDSYTVGYYYAPATELIIPSFAGQLGGYAGYEQIYAESVYENYLSIDSETEAYMKGIIDKEGFDLSNPNVIKNVAEYIQHAAVYSKSYDRTMDSKGNIVIAFLEEYKEGVCRHYATAAVFLYRALGIPARYVTGYMANTVAGEYVEITSEQAHAWVEVYINGTGWIQVEVTGSDSGGSGGDTPGGNTPGGDTPGGDTPGGDNPGGDGPGGGGSGGGGGVLPNGDFSDIRDNSGSGEGEGEPFVVGEIMADSSGVLYLRLRSYGDFLGGVWTPGPSYDKLLPGGYNHNYLTSAALANSGLSSMNATFRNMLTTVLPYYLALDGGDYTRPENDIYNVPLSDSYSVGYYVPSANLLFSSLAGQLGEYAEYEQMYADAVYKNYLSVDGETKAYMQAIIDKEGFDLSDPYVIKKIATYIQNAATYNLDYDKAMDGESNIVIAFLEEYKEGVCRHYATAAVLLYRALGIPARYVTGYMANTIADEYVEITDKQAHAWVEVYIDGVGWMQVEVTGSTPGGDLGGGGMGGGSGIGGSGNDDEPKDKDILIVEPNYQGKIYDGTILLPDAKDLKGNALFVQLIAKGYTFEASVSGSQKAVGQSESVIESFRIFDENGYDVTSLYQIELKTGVLKVFPQDKSVIRVYLYQLQKYYDGKALTFAQDDFKIVEIKDGASLSLNLNISLTDVGYLSLSDLNGEIEKYISYRVTENGRDVTDQYLIEFVEIEGCDFSYVPISFDQRKIEVTAGSAEKIYDGTDLTCDDFFVSLGSVAEGHRIEVTTQGVIAEPGSEENEIVSVKIFDQNHKNVTENYDISMKNGSLTVHYPES